MSVKTIVQMNPQHHFKIYQTHQRCDESELIGSGREVLNIKEKIVYVFNKTR